MKKIKFENLSKDELFEKIKEEYAQKAKYDFVIGIVLALICLAIIIFEGYLFFTKGESISFVLAFAITLVISLEKVLFSLKAKKIVKANNAEEMLSLNDTFNLKIGKCLPFIAVLGLFLIGYAIYHMLTETNIERFGVFLFWLIIALFVLCFVFLLIIPVKGNAKDIGWKDEPIERLRELVEKEKQDTL